MQDFFTLNAAALEPIYPGLAKQVQSSSSVPPQTLSHLDELSFHSVWTPSVELHIVIRFAASPLPSILFASIHEANLLDSGNRRLLLIDDRLEVVRWSLERHDWRAIIQSERCLMIVGDSIEKAVNQLITKYPEISHASFQVYPGEQSCSNEEIEGVRQRLEAAKQQFKTAITQSIQSKAAQGNAVYPNIIRFFAAGHNYLQEACADAFQRLGYEAQRLQWKNPLYTFIRHTAWIHAYRKEEVDTAVFVNSTPRSFTSIEFFRMVPIKSIAWFVDNPRRFEQPDTNIFEECDVIGVFDPTYISYLQSKTSSPVIEARTGYGIDESHVTQPSQFDGIEVAFVGELGAQGNRAYQQGFSAAHPDVLPIIEEILAQFDPEQTSPLTPWVEQRFSDNGIAYRGSLTAFVENLAAYHRRLHYLQGLSPDQLSIFGPSEWGELEETGTITEAYQGHKLDYFTELPNLYAGAKINLNIFHPQCAGAPNPRVYDVLACGGFLLTTPNSGLEDEFVVGEDFDVFHTREELVEKVHYYLINERLRHEMARQGQKRVLATCGYSDRLQQLLAALP